MSVLTAAAAGELRVRPRSCGEGQRERVLPQTGDAAAQSRLRSRAVTSQWDARDLWSCRGVGATAAAARSRPPRHGLCLRCGDPTRTSAPCQAGGKLTCFVESSARRELKQDWWLTRCFWLFTKTSFRVKMAEGLVRKADRSGEFK